jgi:hypothetical protein
VPQLQIHRAIGRALLTLASKHLQIHRVPGWSDAASVRDPGRLDDTGRKPKGAK